MATRTYDLTFTATFRRQVEVDSEQEAQAILDGASVEEVYTNSEWDIDPWEFHKELDFVAVDDEDESKEVR